MSNTISEYVFLGIVRIQKINEILRLMDNNTFKLSFIVPECQKNEITIVKKKYKLHINSVYFITGIQKKKIDQEVDILDNAIEQIQKLFLTLTKHTPDIKGVIPSCEAAVYPAAVIRTFFNIPGLQAQVAILFRDKFKMKKRIELAGAHRKDFITLPKYARLKNFSVKNIIYQMELLNISFPIILKPRFYGGSLGVYLVQDMNHLQTIPFKKNNTLYEINEYIPHKIAHSNGIIDEGRVILVSNYYYNDTPLKCGCRGKNSIAHIEISDTELNQKINSFTAEVMHRLGMQQGVFHLELFVDQYANLIFLEVAARTPGALTVPIIELTTGINLQTVSCLMDMNCDNWKNYIKKNQICIKNKYYGEYIIPIQLSNPIKVVDINLTQITGVNMEKTILPKIGDEIVPSQTLYPNLGILLFSGKNTTHLFHQYYKLLTDSYVQIKKIENNG